MNTKFYIEETLIGMLEEKSIDKIFVSDIIKQTGVCKKTFYKYYCDKYDLLVCSFEKRLYCNLNGETNLSAFLFAYASEVMKMRKTILNAFYSEDICSLKEYNIKFLANHIGKLFDSDFCEKTELAVLLGVYAETITAETVRWLKQDYRSLKISTVNSFVNLLLKMMPYVLKELMDNKLHEDRLIVNIDSAVAV